MGFSFPACWCDFLLWYSIAIWWHKIKLYLSALGVYACEWECMLVCVCTVGPWVCVCVAWVCPNLTQTKTIFGCQMTRASEEKRGRRWQINIMLLWRKRSSFTRQTVYKTYIEIIKKRKNPYVLHYIINLSFSLRPSSHGTEQNMGDPWREEAVVISYITITTLFTVQQSFFSVRHGKEVYRSDDMIWLIYLIYTNLFSTTKDQSVTLGNKNAIVQVYQCICARR